MLPYRPPTWSKFTIVRVLLTILEVCQFYTKFCDRKRCRASPDSEWPLPTTGGLLYMYTIVLLTEIPHNSMYSTRIPLIGDHVVSSSNSYHNNVPLTYYVLCMCPSFYPTRYIVTHELHVQAYYLP
jgi:hypothetical protein